MGITLRRYDTAEYLTSTADMATYLEACIEEASSDASFMAEAIDTVARAKGMMQICRELGIPRDELSAALLEAPVTDGGRVSTLARSIAIELRKRAAQEHAA